MRRARFLDCRCLVLLEGRGLPVRTMRLDWLKVNNAYWRYEPQHEVAMKARAGGARRPLGMQPATRIRKKSSSFQSMNSSYTAVISSHSSSGSPRNADKARLCGSYKSKSFAIAWR